MSARQSLHAGFVWLRLHPFELLASISLLWVLWLIVCVVQLGLADHAAARVFGGGPR